MIGVASTQSSGSITPSNEGGVPWATASGRAWAPVCMCPSKPSFPASLCKAEEPEWAMIMDDADLVGS